MEERLNALLSILESTPKRWNELTQRVPDHLIRRAPLPGEWSALECLYHLLNTERNVFPARTGHFLSGSDLPGYDPNKEEGPLDPATSPQAMAADFAQIRLESLEVLSGLGPDDLQRRSSHERFGVVTLDEMLHEWAAHDLNHTVQAEQALMQPFIQGSGPWKEFFSAHDISNRN